MRTVLTGGPLFDGTAAPLAQADVVIEDGRIVEVGPGLDGDEGVDVTGHALLPGLFDCHIHVSGRYEDFIDETKVLHRPFPCLFFPMPEILRWILELGITTIRDASGADLGLKMAVQDGLVLGPRMQISVNMISITGGHADPWLPSGGRSAVWAIYQGMPDGVCDGGEAVQAKVREMIRAGADVIKIASSGGLLPPSDDPKLPHCSQAAGETIPRTAADRG